MTEVDTKLKAQAIIRLVYQKLARDVAVFGANSSVTLDMEGPIAQALQDAYNQGRASVLDKWPSRDDSIIKFQSLEEDVSALRLNPTLLASQAWSECLYWLAERLGVV